MEPSTEKKEIRSLPLNGGAQEGLIYGYAANYEAYDALVGGLPARVDERRALAL